MAVKISTTSVLILSLALLSFSHCCYGQLRVGFYNKDCRNVENIVSRVVGEAFFKDPSLAPAMIRLYFHDCFSNGCDASLLLDGTSSEKKASPNLSVRGYELIDDIKTAVEQECSGIISCADIIALATRDLVTLASGRKTWYAIPTGRFDGTVSLASSVDLPSPRLTVSQTADKFFDRKLSLTDMVLLLGGHTIGVTHCSFIMDRLYNFQNTKLPDPSMDSKLVQELKFKCPQGSSSDGIINLDQNFTSSNTMDVSFYKQINSRRGILHIDQQLAIDGMTSKIVTDIANGNDFLFRFGQAMVNLGWVGVKTKANGGEIRKSCRSCKDPLFCATS
ncbi:PREDICTED: peroxidase 60-like [Camelina sativa]|uniref:Peroxidase n=1 Tax=Camelina sativa TaxID=90675 RepID=A0ABM0T559_CAMSA|nr:PREDICTED: peroxidase 60-like [Camelina sativa]